MGVVKYCDKCHKRISIREMPNGVWIPFEFNSDKVHKCAVKNNHSQKMTKAEEIKKAIVEKKDILFNYKGKSDVITKERCITPLSFDSRYVTGFCYTRKENRTFNIDKMHYIKTIEPNTKIRKNLNVLAKMDKPEELDVDNPVINKDCTMKVSKDLVLKFELISTAIENDKNIAFKYLGQNEIETIRVITPSNIHGRMVNDFLIDKMFDIEIIDKVKKTDDYNSSKSNLNSSVGCLTIVIVLILISVISQFH